MRQRAGHLSLRFHTERFELRWFLHAAGRSSLSPVKMARAYAVALLAVSAATLLMSVATVQIFDDELPPQLAGNYSGLACSPVWNNFVLRYAQDKDNVLRVVLSTMWVLQGRPHGGLQRHGGVDRQDEARARQAVLAAGEDLLAGGRGQGVPGLQQPRPHRACDQAKIYLAFQLRFTEPLKSQNGSLNGYTFIHASK